MTVETTSTQEEGRPAGASSHVDDTWDGIRWYRTQRNVRRLQARIVKATQEKRWNKVKVLQRLLTRSFSGKALAVRRVTENQGKKTPGVDQVLWDTPEKKAQAIHDLRQRGYHPQPLRRVYIPKSNGARRPLSIPTMKDRAMQALYLLALQPVAETLADPHSYGFRPERCTADAIVYCHFLFSRKSGAKWALEGDIKSCFDAISHDWLLASASKWHRTSREDGNCVTSGKNKKEYVRCANRRSPRSRDGTTTTLSGRAKEAHIMQLTGFFCTLPAIGNCTARVYMWRNRVPLIKRGIRKA